MAGQTVLHDESIGIIFSWHLYYLAGSGPALFPRLFFAPFPLVYMLIASALC